ncbi:putative phosphoesterase, SbcD/Mre11-related/metallophosphoesterase, DNA ligase-associated [Catalinimonas alkaloidigena]|uniref:Putative phosphoesterase, SbcD/Mre11-related/metallophosphoesterase, DNA ligase-associated n=1 Tax=Catalinimonas alkaloidigena TaxID=1075417 RepID=A0A1G9BLJ3_9BACT|nr:ligase-associated DNA damage response endonuclease PdeM [Catalinimonas alkaloidigena]SDK39735.1 putative phosphoesterase, SbcD/Mre11-related/metallophosphoesterase, DNA ligase-associated [Catalinimonas alkaloidigena]
MLQTERPTEALVRGERWQLLPEKALFWPAQGMLLLADLHLGKVAHFRKAGMAVPPAAADENYARLEQLMQRLPVTRLVLLGDLFHSDANADWLRFEAWCERYPQVSIELVKGNHDILPTGLYRHSGLVVHETALRVGPFLLTHIPPEHLPAGVYCLAGHIHPAVRLRGQGATLQLPCFHFGSVQGLLPAFGSFTGTALVRPKSGDQVFVIAEQRVIQVA